MTRVSNLALRKRHKFGVPRVQTEPLGDQDLQRGGQSVYLERSISVANQSTYRFHQAVSRASLLCELSAELRGDPEGGVRSVGGRSYSRTTANQRALSRDNMLTHFHEL